MYRRYGRLKLFCLSHKTRRGMGYLMTFRDLGQTHARKSVTDIRPSSDTRSTGSFPWEVSDSTQVSGKAYRDLDRGRDIKFFRRALFECAMWLSRNENSLQFA
jgi:hypothetical protein